MDINDERRCSNITRHMYNYPSSLSAYFQSLMIHLTTMINLVNIARPTLVKGPPFMKKIMTIDEEATPEMEAITIQIADHFVARTLFRVFGRPSRLSPVLCVI